MTVIKINAITVPADSGDELAQRFAARAGAVDDQDGFEGFELFKPVDDRTTWLGGARGRDEESFQAWLSSPSFAHGHRSASERAGGDAPKPVGVHSELWSYEIAGGSAKSCPRAFSSPRLPPDSPPPRRRPHHHHPHRQSQRRTVNGPI